MGIDECYPCKARAQATKNIIDRLTVLEGEHRGLAKVLSYDAVMSENNEIATRARIVDTRANMMQFAREIVEEENERFNEETTE